MTALRAAVTLAVFLRCAVDSVGAGDGEGCRVCGGDDGRSVVIICDG
jgi:hypothetical protein